MKIAVPKEQCPDEARVALTPDVAARFMGAGWKVCVERGAGEGARIPDSAFQEKGVEIAKDASALYKDTDILLKVRAPTVDEATLYPKGMTLIGMVGDMETKVQTYLVKKQVRAFCLLNLPRISRAQSMDVLSSQNTVAGYAAVVCGAEASARMFPLLMTAAGTLAPAKVFVLGAGVAGLQAIATAKRLGARVTAYDVRPEVKEQIQSLGADFFEVELKEQVDSQGGYAQALSEETKKRQQEAMTEAFGKMDVIITTALTVGKKAPVLISKDMVESMRVGSVIVDMAAPSGGNCALTKPGKCVQHQGVSILGPTNLPSRYAGDASMLYAKNLWNFVSTLWNPEGTLKADADREILEPTLIVGELPE